MAIIKTMSLTKMHNNSHLEFHTSVSNVLLESAFANQKFAQLYNSYRAELAVERNVIGRPRASVLTPDVITGREERDGEFIHYINVVRSGRRSSIPERKAAADKLWIISKPYKDVYSLFIPDSIDKVRELMKLLGTDENADLIDALTLGASAQKLRQLNNKLSTTYTERAIERGSLPDKDISSREQRRKVDIIYKELVATLNSVEISTRAGIETGFDAEKLNSVIVDINSFIDQYKMTIANYAKKQKKEEMMDEEEKMKGEDSME